MVHLLADAAFESIGVWCNWQHSGFWYRHSWFESRYPSEQSRIVGIPTVRLFISMCSVADGGGSCQLLTVLRQRGEPRGIHMIQC